MSIMANVLKICAVLFLSFWAIARGGDTDPDWYDNPGGAANE